MYRETQAFENDELAIGKWEIRDIVSNKEQFVYGQPKCPEASTSVWGEMCLLEGGKPYSFIKGWTKGFIYLEATIPESHLVAIPYDIETLNGCIIMFLQVPRYNADGSIDPIPQLLVFEKSMK